MNIEQLESRRLLASSIAGFVYDDANGNGVRDAGEGGFKGTKVYLDLNHDGVRQKNEPTQKTSKTGAYSFDDLAADSFDVRIIAKKKLRQTSPSTGYFTITTNGDDIHVANDFGLTKTAKVSGKVFNDLNQNGVQDNGESPIPDVLVFLDKNKNGVWESSKELARVTDSDGLYSFEAVPPKKYMLRVALPDGASTTTPLNGFYKLKLKAGQTVSDQDFGLI